MRTCLVHYVNNLLGAAPFVPNGHTGHNQKPCLELESKQSPLYVSVPSHEVNRVDQIFVFVGADRRLEVRAGSRAPAFGVEKPNYISVTQGNADDSPRESAAGSNGQALAVDDTSNPS